MQQSEQMLVLQTWEAGCGKQHNGAAAAAAASVVVQKGRSGLRGTVLVQGSGPVRALEGGGTSGWSKNCAAPNAGAVAGQWMCNNNGGGGQAGGQARFQGGGGQTTPAAKPLLLPHPPTSARQGFTACKKEGLVEWWWVESTLHSTESLSCMERPRGLTACPSCPPSCPPPPPCPRPRRPGEHCGERGARCRWGCCRRGRWRRQGCCHTSHQWRLRLRRRSRAWGLQGG